MKDAIIIGGGLAGLSAAWRLRHWDTLVLEIIGAHRRPYSIGKARPVLSQLGRTRLRWSRYLYGHIAD